MEKDNAVPPLERREFLKKAGLAGLALAGLSVGGGCLRRPIGRGESIYAPKSKEGIINKNKLELEDFLFTEEELGGMRCARKGEGNNNTTSKGEIFGQVNILGVEKNTKKTYSMLILINDDKVTCPDIREYNTFCVGDECSTKIYKKGDDKYFN